MGNLLFKRGLAYEHKALVLPRHHDNEEEDHLHLGAGWTVKTINHADLVPGSDTEAQASTVADLVLGFAGPHLKGLRCRRCMSPPSPENKRCCAVTVEGEEDQKRNDSGSCCIETEEEEDPDGSVPAWVRSGQV